MTTLSLRTGKEQPRRSPGIFWRSPQPWRKESGSLERWRWRRPSSAGALLSSLSSSGVGALASAAGKDLGIKNPNDLYVGMLKTRPVADGIIKHFDLQKLYGAKDMTETRKTLADYTEIVSEKEGFISVAVE